MTWIGQERKFAIQKFHVASGRSQSEAAIARRRELGRGMSRVANRRWTVPANIGFSAS
jgi:hypothetical protein